MIKACKIKYLMDIPESKAIGEAVSATIKSWLEPKHSPLKGPAHRAEEIIRSRITEFSQVISRKQIPQKYKGLVLSGLFGADRKPCIVKFVGKGFCYSEVPEAGNREFEICLKYYREPDQHQHIVRVLECGYLSDTNSQTMYIVMEKGLDLEDYVKSLSLSDRFLRKVNLCHQIANILVEIHKRHDNKVILVHRDLKPGNFIVITQNRVATVKMLDFGTSKFYASLDRSRYDLTQFESTTVYRAPELDSVESKIKEPAKVDIYSFAIMLYEILFQVPVQDNTFETLKQQLALRQDSLNRVNIKNNVLKGTDILNCIPDSVQKEAGSLLIQMDDMTRFDPKERNGDLKRTMGFLKTMLNKLEESYRYYRFTDIRHMSKLAILTAEPCIHDVRQLRETKESKKNTFIENWLIFEADYSPQGRYEPFECFLCKVDDQTFDKFNSWHKRQKAQTNQEIRVFDCIKSGSGWLVLEKFALQTVGKNFHKERKYRDFLNRLLRSDKAINNFKDLEFCVQTEGPDRSLRIIAPLVQYGRPDRNYKEERDKFFGNEEQLKDDLLRQSSGQRVLDMFSKAFPDVNRKIDVSRLKQWKSDLDKSRRMFIKTNNMYQFIIEWKAYIGFKKAILIIYDSPTPQQLRHQEMAKRFIGKAVPGFIDFYQSGRASSICYTISEACHTLSDTILPQNFGYLQAWRCMQDILLSLFRESVLSMALLPSHLCVTDGGSVKLGFFGQSIPIQELQDKDWWQDKSIQLFKILHQYYSMLYSAEESTPEKLIVKNCQILKTNQLLSKEFYYAADILMYCYLASYLILKAKDQENDWKKYFCSNAGSLAGKNRPEQGYMPKAIPHMKICHDILEFLRSRAHQQIVDHKTRKLYIQKLTKDYTTISTTVRSFTQVNGARSASTDKQAKQEEEFRTLQTDKSKIDQLAVFVKEFILYHYMYECVDLFKKVHKQANLYRQFSQQEWQDGEFMWDVVYLLENISRKLRKRTYRIFPQESLADRKALDRMTDATYKYQCRESTEGDYFDQLYRKHRLAEVLKIYLGVFEKLFEQIEQDQQKQLSLMQDVKVITEKFDQQNRKKQKERNLKQSYTLKKQTKSNVAEKEPEMQKQKTYSCIFIKNRSQPQT